jgi:hypothetical protein
MNIPLIILLFLEFVNLLLLAYYHGRTMKEPYNFWLQLPYRIIKVVLLLWAVNWMFA